MNRGKKTIDVEAIKDCPIFNGLTGDELAKIARLTTVRKFKDGEEIFHEGDSASELFVLLEGALEVSQKLVFSGADSEEKDKPNKMLNRLEASYRPSVGEMSLFDEHPTRSATMEALGEVKLGAIDKDALMKLARENQHLGFVLLYNIGVILCSRLKKANQDILKLSTAFSLALERGW